MTTTPNNRMLDRRIHFDQQSKQFRIRTAVYTTSPRSYTWTLKQDVLDQGREGHCVGFGISQEAAAKPAIRVMSNQQAHDAFYVAQRIDRERHGLHFVDGATVLAGMKAGVELDFWKEYYWAFGLDDLVLGVGRHGPAILGLAWDNSMFRPTLDGYLVDDGQDNGLGHCVVTIAVNLKEEEFLIPNSWGTDWSEVWWRGRTLRGYAKMKFDVMDRLLNRQGEAVFPSGRVIGPT